MSSSIPRHSVAAQKPLRWTEPRWSQQISTSVSPFPPHWCCKEGAVTSLQKPNSRPSCVPPPPASLITGLGCSWRKDSWFYEAYLPGSVPLLVTLNAWETVASESSPLLFLLKQSPVGTMRSPITYVPLAGPASELTRTPGLVQCSALTLLKPFFVCLFFKISFFLFF